MPTSRMKIHLSKGFLERNLDINYIYNIAYTNGIFKKRLNLHNIERYIKTKQEIVKLEMLYDRANYK